MTDRAVWCVLGVALASACDGGGAGDGGVATADGAGGGGALSVIVEAEDTITQGLEPGMTGEAIQDGWAVAFDEYVVVLGDVDVHLATDERVTAEAPALYAVDLVDVPAVGLPLWELSGLATGRWEIGWAVVGAADGASAHASVPAELFAEMTAGDWTYLVAGAMTRADGQSCPPAALATPGRAPNGNTNSAGDPCYDAPSIAFRFGAQAEAAYGPCQVDDVPGFAITDGATTTVALTIHGDHLFFNGFPEGDEGGIVRLAQWLADCDLDLDGTVTREELARIAPADLAEIDARFQLGGSPITPLTTMWDYVTAQLKTQGHFQGEGECALDGTAHMH